MELHELGSIVRHPNAKHHYQIIDLLGRGGVGITYRATDLNNSRQVALKVVSLRQTKDWKVLELFEREAKVLNRLNHQFIPAYLDYFELETEDDKKFYLVQELVEGKSLANLVADGWHGTELEIREMAIELLNILSYLHSFDPPVIHRDLKPHNIIRHPDGKVYLVDFGAVQDIYRNTVSLGKTFVGTLGYMPLEQLRGDVSPASDLYSLGCTLLFLLAHKSPTDLPQKGLSIDFSKKIRVSRRFEDWLTRILEPIAEDRFQSASAALEAIEKQPTTSLSNVISGVRLPIDSKISVTRTAHCLQVEIPLGVHYPTGLLPTGLKELFVGILGFAFLPEVTTICLVGWIIFSLSINEPRKNAVKAPTRNVEKKTAKKYLALKIDADTFSLERSVRLDLSGKLKIKRQQEFTADIVWVNTIAGEGTKDRVAIAVLKDIDTVPRQYSFGQGHINRTEARWIAQEISNFIEEINS